MTGFVNLSILVLETGPMSQLKFHKYHGTGNDFILLDNRSGHLDLNEQDISRLCHRRFGIGADGMMMLQASAEHDFEMKYFNSDGREGSMCGNGGRSIAAFAFQQGIIGTKTRFQAVDGIHHAEILEAGNKHFVVKVSLNEVGNVQPLGPGSYLLDTGSPHYVEFVSDLSKVDVYHTGKKIRWDKTFQPGGVNVNFVERQNDILVVRTFERGVEDITLSCGTGVTASAIAASGQLDDGDYSWELQTLGGTLTVSFIKTLDRFTGIWLIGPVEHVFDGTI